MEIQLKNVSGFVALTLVDENGKILGVKSTTKEAAKSNIKLEVFGLAMDLIKGYMLSCGDPEKAMHAFISIINALDIDFVCDSRRSE